MRLVAMVGMLGGTVLLAACGREPATAPGAATVDFGTQCAALAAAPAEVVVAPVAVRDDATRSRAELTALYERARPGHETMGLTQTRTTYDTRIEFTGREARGPDRACVRPRIRIEIAMNPITVFVARDLADDACRRDVVHEHEMKHVAVYKSHLAAAATQLAAALDADVATQVFTAGTTAGAQAAAAADVAARIDAFEREDSARLHDEQADVDAPEEYERVAAACRTP